MRDDTRSSDAPPGTFLPRSLPAGSRRITPASLSGHVPVQAYLTWAFERLGTHGDVFGLELEAMTPAAFRRARAP